MKKHEAYEHNGLMERLCDEFNVAKTLRELSYIALLYIEYYINEILIRKFQHPEKLIDENELGSFKNKLLVLEAVGIFDVHPHLLSNITLIQRIRNYYAHNLLASERAPEPVASRIKQLVYFDRNNVVGEYDVPWSEHADPLESQLHVCSLSTTNGLIRICYGLTDLSGKSHEAEPGA
jgi:hypothetical protein